VLLGDFLKMVKSDGITVIENKKEEVTPKTPTRDMVRINVFAPSFKKRKGRAQAIVVAVV
jgi:hypothetical protein